MVKTTSLTRVRRLLGLCRNSVLALTLIAVTSAKVWGQSSSVDCDAGAKLSTSILAAQPGTTIRISGSCHENVTVPARLQDIVLDGGGAGTIIGPNAQAAVITVLGREITIRGLHLIDGRNGINILRGASAVVDGVTIEHTGKLGQPGSGLGMNIGQHAFAAVVNSTIRDNPSVGILVHENSGARIGFIDVASTPLPNTITGNGIGVLVTEAAQARIVGAVIARNKAAGIRVERASHLEVAENTIEGNGGDGISVTQGSGAVVEIGTGTITRPNRTSAGAKNGQYGIRCSVGGFVSGRLGTLTGALGPARFDSGCIDGLVP